MLEYKRMNSRSAARVQELERRKTALQAGLQGIEVCWTEVRRFLILFLARFRSCTRNGRTDSFIRHVAPTFVLCSCWRRSRASLERLLCLLLHLCLQIVRLFRRATFSTLFPRIPSDTPALFPPARSLTGGCVCCPRTHEGGGSAESEHEGAPAQVCRAL